jgi:hypothetical protein
MLFDVVPTPQNTAATEPEQCAVLLEETERPGLLRCVVYALACKVHHYSQRRVLCTAVWL